MIGRKLKEARVKAGLKQKDVAKDVGIATTYLCLIENEKANATKNIIELIMEVIHVDVDFPTKPKKG